MNVILVNITSSPDDGKHWHPQYTGDIDSAPLSALAVPGADDDRRTAEAVHLRTMCASMLRREAHIVLVVPGWMLSVERLDLIVTLGCAGAA